MALQDLVSNYTSVAGLLVSFIGGGWLTTWRVEKFNRRREERQFVYARLEKLHAAYQLYVRNLRSKDEDRNRDLDLAHADLLAQTKLLTCLESYAEFRGPLDSLARKFANIRAHENDRDGRDNGLKEVSGDLDRIVKDILGKLK